jgi:hypothetical protein
VKEVLKVVQFGCGPVGCAIARLAAGKKGISVAGAIDLTNPGADLGELAGMKQKLGIIVSSDADTVLRRTKPDVVLHATGSSLDKVFPQLEKIMGFGASIVSTCEELSYPYKKYPEITAKIDRLAKKNKVTVLGTGVNPGFLMDAWPLYMTSICQDVQQVKAVRIQDASPRRIPFQKKIGAGKTVEEFNELVKKGTLRHVGLAESIAHIAAGLGWTLDTITETIEPVIAQTEVSSNYVTVKPGQAVGVKQVGLGLQEGKTRISLDFQAYIGAKESYDAVYITGIPDVEAIIKGGTHGDLATAAMIVNCVPRVYEAAPGLITMKDLPTPYALPNKERG